MNRSKWLITIFQILFLIMLSNKIFAEKNNSSNNDMVQYLFVLTSDEGAIKFNKPMNIYEIKIKNTHPWVTYFSISPDKKTGFMPIEKFPKVFDEIDKEKNKAGLNSAIVAKPVNKGDSETYTLTLVSMRYDKDENIIKFTAKLLPGSKVDVVPHLTKLRNIALFIDEGCASCGGAGI